jgi:hypothetical protein
MAREAITPSNIVMITVSVLVVYLFLVLLIRALKRRKN